MSHISNAPSEPQVKSTTPDNENALDQHSPYRNLNLKTIVLSRAPQECCHDFSAAGLTERWKGFWNEKICLLWLQPEEEKWPDIIRWFKERGEEKTYDALYSEWSRVSNEVSSQS